MSKRAVLYARVSGDDRSNSTSSLKGQIELCREHALSKNWQIVDELSEDYRGASGASMDLPKLSEALKLAAEKKFDVLVVREIDRLARNLAKQLVIEKEFERFGVSIDYVIGDYQNTPEGQLSKHVRAVIAEYEREKIKERMLRGRRRKARSGYVVLHGNVLYGYKAIEENGETVLVIDEPIAEIIRMIFDWYITNKWGSPTIAKKLNQLGIATPSITKNIKTPKATKWNQSQVQRIIKNEAYAGKWRYGKRSPKGKNPKEYHIVVDIPAIVTPETFQKAQLQRGKNTNRAGRQPKYNYLLSRRLKCGECHASMVALTKTYPKKLIPYYRCPVPGSHGTHYLYTKCTVTKHFRADYWDNAVWQEIRGFLADSDKLTKGIEQYRQQKKETNAPVQERVNLINDLIDQNKQKLSRLLELFLSGEFDKDVLIDQKRKLEGTIKALEEERENLKSQIDESLTDAQLNELKLFSEQIREGLAEADEDFETRRKLIGYFGVKVTLFFENGQQSALLHCEFGHKSYLTKPVQTSSRQPGSEHPANSHEEGADNCMPNYKRSTDCKRS